MTYQSAEFDSETNLAPASSSAQTGLAAGTVILTLRGEVAVEDLRVGDKVITRDRGAQPLRDLTQHTGTVSVIARNSMGENRPARDVRVATTQPILNRGDNTSIAAAMDFVSVLRGAVDSSLLYRLCFDSEHIIYADGLELTTARA